MPDESYVPREGETFHFELYLDGPCISAIGRVRGCDPCMRGRDQVRAIDYYLDRMRTAAYQILTDQTVIRHILDLKTLDGCRQTTYGREEFIQPRDLPSISSFRGGRRP